MWVIRELPAILSKSKACADIDSISERRTITPTDSIRSRSLSRLSCGLFRPQALYTGEEENFSAHLLSPYKRKASTFPSLVSNCLEVKECDIDVLANRFDVCVCIRLRLQGVSAIPITRRTSAGPGATRHKRRHVRVTDSHRVVVRNGNLSGSDFVRRITRSFN